MLRTRIFRPAQLSYRLGLGCLLILLLLSAVLAPAAAAQTDQAATLTVNSVLVNVHGGPSVTVPVVATLSRGEQATITGYQANGDWWQVSLPGGGGGWVRDRDNNFSISGDTTPFTSPPVTQASTQTTSTLVFQTSSGGVIYAVDVDPATGIATSGARLLTTGMDPAISPDGQQVAFTRWTNENNGALGSLWVINVDGSGERVVRENIHQPKSPTWSADGTQIAINVMNGGRDDYEYRCTSQIPSDPIYNPDEDNRSGIKVKIEHEEDGDISVRFCYTLLPHPYWGIMVLDVATGKGDIVPSNEFAYGPTWDPVNDWRIIYRDSDKGLAGLDLNGGAGWALGPQLPYATTNDLGDYAPTFSPDGSKLADTYWQNDHWDVHVLNPDGSGRIRLTETPLADIGQQILDGYEPRSWNNASPAWSPDGSKIAFITDRSGQSGQYEIWVMNADGSNPHPLFTDGLPDGISILYEGVGERVLSWK